MAHELNRNRVRGNVLLVLNTFVLFLLLFEKQLVIPVWLQPVGRMHPMFVHFPIVVLLLAMVLDAIRLSLEPANTKERFYSAFARDLLFAGVVLSGITVIMGLFLAQEEGYDGEGVSLHKWLGVAVFLISSAISILRESAWFAPSVARASAVVVSLIIVIAGHSGGELTHGDNFVWKPVMTDADDGSLALEDARTFDHVIKPVLEAKCVSCHNADKRKGKLLLTDTASILKGGKTGELFVAGQPGNSLLITRIGLPLHEKKHMPPSDRPQLTREEKDLLFLWIRSGANFGGRISELPENDSFRIAATRAFERRENADAQFDFPPATPQTLARLNSNYRVIRPVSKNSPALSVNVYNRSIYSPATLEELGEVKRQVVELDLSKMPVDDKDLQHIGRLENLRKLYLNFTAVTGAGLSHLRRLEFLEHLSISGTQVKFDDVRETLRHLKNLQTLAVWETALSPQEIARLQAEFPDVTVLGAPQDDMALIKLNTPRVNNKWRVFEDSINLELVHPVRDVDIRFTTDGKEPDSLGSTLFAGKTVLRETTTITAKAYKEGWLSSDVAELNVYRSAHKPDSAILLSKLNRVHVANGAMTFFDHQLGSFNANSPAWANNWGGVRNNDLELLVRYDSPRKIASVSLHTLIELENVIFPPALIEVWGGSARDDLRLIGKEKVEIPTDYRKPYMQLFDCEFEEREVSYLKIIAKPVMKIPAWHKNKDRAALLLVDEVLIN